MAGSYEKRKDSYRLIYEFKGKRHTKTIKLTKGQKIERELDKFIEEIQENSNINKNINFTVFSQKWLDEYVRPNLRERTVKGYKDYLNLRLVPYFGHMSLSDIQLYDIQKFVNSLKEELTSCTIKKYKNCLSGIFTCALKWQFVKYNHCIGIEIPKGKDSNFKPVFLNKTESDVLLEKLQNENLKYQIIVRLALQCGMRRSEILGLPWNSINFDENTINIYQTASVIKGGTVIANTKNKSSNRIIYAKKEIMDLIESLPKTHNLVFGYMHSDTVTSWFNKFLKKHELKNMRFHDLRHTHATLLIANNIDMKTVSNRLGHSNISTTMNIYTHALSENDKKASEII